MNRLRRALLPLLIGAGACTTRATIASRPSGERWTVNARIRTSGTFDGVIDFDAATRDPANPRNFKSPFDSGDHLHPSDAGYKAMGEAIDLALFRRT